LLVWTGLKARRQVFNRGRQKHGKKTHQSTSHTRCYFLINACTQ